MKTRNPLWDLVKFAAILIVVFWHVQKAAEMSAGQPVVTNLIVNMNMPLFFLISGYFSYGLVSGGDWKKFGWRVLGYFWPLMILSIVFNFFEWALGLPGYVDSFPKEVLKGFLVGGWYLYVLAMCVASVFLCFRLRGGVKTRIASLVLLFVASLFIRHAWWVPYFRHMFPFFVVGFGVKAMKNVEVEKMLTWKAGVPCLALYILAAVLEGTAYQHRLYFYGVDSFWWGLTADWQAPIWELAHYALGILGSVGVMWAIVAFLKVAPIVGKLAPLGETTLGVYLLHQWLLKRVVEHEWLWSSVWLVVLWTAILFFITHGLTKLSMSTRILRIACWGKLK